VQELLAVGVDPKEISAQRGWYVKPRSGSLPSIFELVFYPLFGRFRDLRRRFCGTLDPAFDVFGRWFCGILAAGYSSLSWTLQWIGFCSWWWFDPMTPAQPEWILVAGCVCFYISKGCTGKIV
jgi:hypothetical protein